MNCTCRHRQINRFFKTVNNWALWRFLIHPRRTLQYNCKGKHKLDTDCGLSIYFIKNKLFNNVLTYKPLWMFLTKVRHVSRLPHMRLTRIVNMHICITKSYKEGQISLCSIRLILIWEAVAVFYYMWWPHSKFNIVILNAFICQPPSINTISHIPRH